MTSGSYRCGVANVERAVLEFGVIFFRDQQLNPEQHIAFAERLGLIDINRFFKADGYPQIAEVRKEADQKSNIGGGWHTDYSYDHIPAKGSLLYARELPPVGGDTLFSSMYAAYEALSRGLQKTLEGLKALHSGISRSMTIPVIAACCTGSPSRAHPCLNGPTR